MKLTNTHTTKRKAGMTLLELTVVILVLLSLISILFVGARAWKKGSDRAANILNVRNVQQAVRAHVNVNGLATTDTTLGVTGSSLPDTDIIGPGKYMNDVKPPVSGLSYTYQTTVPAIGDLYITNSDLGAAAGEYFYDYGTGGADEGKIADW